MNFRAWESRGRKTMNEVLVMKKRTRGDGREVVKRRRSKEHEWVWPGRLVTYCISWSQWFRSEAFPGVGIKSFVVDMNEKQ